MFSPLEIAPMIDWTYVHFRVFMRILAPRALLYTEMQTIGAIRHNPSRALAFHESELPQLALQVGGADVESLVEVALKAESLGFSEINLNLGCPSDKVQAGHFGACLMREPSLVSACIVAMKRAVSIPVTAKVRIGVDEDDDYAYFSSFVHQLHDSGCDKFVVHARKAWLHGLSPKQNRTIPPLHYDYVYRIKQALPKTPVIINGNIQPADIPIHLQRVDGVMLGRLACDSPYQIALIHHALHPESPLPTRLEAFQYYVSYLENSGIEHYSMSLILKPILNLAHGLPGNRQWKAHLLSIRSLDDRALFLQAMDILKNLESGTI
jgi:tRNA-dihydrouridine synthase A